MPATKRAAPKTPSGRRRSQRVSSSTMKSSYFEGDDSDDLDRGRAVKSSSAKKGSGRPAKRARKEASEDDYGSGSDEEDDEFEDEDFDDEDDVEKPVKRWSAKKERAVLSRPTRPAKKAKKEESGNEDDEDDDEDEDRRPRVTVVPLEQLRPTGGVEYEDQTLHKNTLLFLKDLKANNNRPWLKSHDGEYRRSLKDWQSYVETITTKIAEVDFTVPELPAKDLIFRIHRDVRFSHDQTPYKPHFSAAWSRTGKKGPYACYYIHIEPGASFVGGGLWHPDGPAVQRIRASIDERPRRWRRVLNDPGFRRTFLPQAAGKAGEEAALKAFADRNKENALKTRPKGFIAEHRDIELLKLRNYTASTKVDDGVLTAADSQEQLVRIVGDMVGFITFLNSVVMPDPDASDSDSDSDGDEDGGDEDAPDGGDSE